MTRFGLNILLICVCSLKFSKSQSALTTEAPSTNVSLTPFEEMNSLAVPGPRFECDSMEQEQFQSAVQRAETYALFDTKELGISPHQRVLRVASRAWTLKRDEGQFAFEWVLDLCPSLVNSDEEIILKQFLRFAYTVNFDADNSYASLKAVAKFDDGFRKYYSLPTRLYDELTSAAASNWSILQDIYRSFPSDANKLESLKKPGTWKDARNALSTLE